MEWIKLSTGLFKDEKIKVISSEKNGSEIVLVWVKLLCLAGEQEQMGVFKIFGRAMTPKILATVTDTQEKLMEQALSMFIDYGMIVQDNGFYMIPNWEKHQEVEKQEAKREATAKRVAEFRQRQKRMVVCNADVTADVTHDVTHDVTECNADVTQTERYSNATEEDIDIDIDNPPYNPPLQRNVTRNAEDGDESASASFQAFWAAYPKKEGRTQAEKAWRSINPDTDLMHVIIAAVDRDKGTDAWHRENGRYIPMPAKYLTERRWEDQHVETEERGERTYSLQDAFRRAVDRQRKGAMA